MIKWVTVQKSASVTYDNIKNIKIMFKAQDQSAVLSLDIEILIYVSVPDRNRPQHICKSRVQATKPNKK